MKVDAKQFKGRESGSVVIIGNGPDMNNYIEKDFLCPIIGINLSVNYWPEQDYFVTVAYDRLQDIALGKIRAKKAVFSTLQKAHAVPNHIPQPIVWVDMSLPDDYAQTAGKTPQFDPDLLKPTHATFGGIYALQVAMFLGYNPIYLVGFYGGGLEHFYPRVGFVPVEHHLKCHWHIAEYLKAHPEIKVYQTNPKAHVNCYPIKEVPTRPKESEITSWLSISGGI